MYSHHLKIESMLKPIDFPNNYQFNAVNFECLI